MGAVLMPVACSLPSYPEFASADALGGGGSPLGGSPASGEAGDAGSAPLGGDAGSAAAGGAGNMSGAAGAGALAGSAGNASGGAESGGTAGVELAGGGSGASTGGSAGSGPVVPTLSVVISPASDTLDLSAEGTADWVHWGDPDILGIDRKAGVASAKIGALSGVNAPVLRDFSNGTTFSWSDGTPRPSAQTQNYLYIAKLDSGIDLPVAADTTLQTLRVYFGLYSGQGKLTVSLSDASAPPYSTTRTVAQDTSLHDQAKVVFRAGKAGQTLHFNWVLTDVGTFSNGGNVTLAAATLE